jgi:hypothetical protein
VENVVVRNQELSPEQSPEPGPEQAKRERPQVRRSVDLDIAGADFMLAGHFADWESGLTVGPDLDRVNVRLAIDATSAREAEPGESLFSFRSREVEVTGPAAYRAVGTFTGPLGSRALEMTIESPLGHTALVVASFAARRQDFGDGWHDLIANVVPFVGDADGAPTRQAHAWLIPPALGAA